MAWTSRQPCQEPTMTATARRYTSEPGFTDDFFAVREFLVRIGVWESDGEVVGLVTYEEGPGGPRSLRRCDAALPAGRRPPTSGPTSSSTTRWTSRPTRPGRGGHDGRTGRSRALLRPWAAGAHAPATGRSRAGAPVRGRPGPRARRAGHRTLPHGPARGDRAGPGRPAPGPGRVRPGQPHPGRRRVLAHACHGVRRRLTAVGPGTPPRHLEMRRPSRDTMLGERLADMARQAAIRADGVAMELRLEAQRPAVAVARHWVAQCARDEQLPPQLVPVVELLTSELVSNAVLHGPRQGCVTVQAIRQNSQFTVAVTDQSPDPPVVRTTDVDVPGGQGMRLVDRLSSAWGVQLDATGKAVWFQVLL